MDDIRVRRAMALIRYPFAIALIAIGLDQIASTNLITQWSAYVSPAIAAMLPLSIDTFVIVLGVVELLAGIMLLTRYVRIAAYLAIFLLALIVIDLLMLGSIDVALRDILLAFALAALAQLAPPTEGFAAWR